MSSKLIVTNNSVLKGKYGTGLSKIKTALQSLIASDKKRGFVTTVVDIADAKTMKKFKGKPASPGNPKQNKLAIDAVCRSVVPDYLVILGSIDVIPHQPLKNPLYEGPNGDDPDEFVWSDLPYACEAGYSQSPADFVGPTRVTGRIPDLVAGTDPAFLIGLLKTATTWVSATAENYRAFLGITAKVWQKSTQLSLQKIFGTSKGMHTSPAKGPGWSNKELQPLVHFINCHGASSDTKFYGQQGASYPEAHDAAWLETKISPGTVVAAECCYGAELYDPAHTGNQAGIACTCLKNGAFAFLGSTTIAYGPAAGNGSADLICQYFVKRILNGSSTGRACLEARQEFAGGAPELDATDLKTIAQFILLGDPSIHPAAPTSPHAAGPGFPVAKGMKALSLSGADVTRGDRRRQLLRRGLRLAEDVVSVVKSSTPPAASSVKKQLTALAKQLKLDPVNLQTFVVPEKIESKSAGAKRVLKNFASRHALPEAIHVISQRDRADGRVVNIELLVAKEQGGKIVSYRNLLSR